jgi:hypothetical protein
MNDAARDPKKLTVILMNDAFVLGRHFEDQEERIEEDYYLVVEDERGYRWAHRHHFRMEHSCSMSGCYDDREDISDFVCKAFAAQPYKSSEDAQAAALKLQERIKKAQADGSWKGPWGNDQWEETRPAYGSEAYEREDQGRQDAICEAKAEGVILPF